jgi:segregation and condensation protein A
MNAAGPADDTATLPFPDDGTDGLLAPAELSIKLPVFEGPLDLLLFLIRRHEIDIYDIPIETVLKQYLTVLRGMEQLSLEVAGEFFVMAATLMYIKSRMLLPPDTKPEAETEEEEPEADPRWELVQQLLEYRRFKEAANQLGDLAEEHHRHVPRIVDPGKAAPRPLLGSDRIEVWNTFNLVLRRLAEKIRVGDIFEETVTVADRMEFLIGRLREHPSFTFSSLFSGRRHSIAELVATFLAVLELARLRELDVAQDEHYAEILLCRAKADSGQSPE